jgi:hypothetical protein
VARVSAKGCSMHHGVGEVRGTKVRGEVAAAARGERGRRLGEGGCVGLKTSNVGKYNTTLLLV